MKINAKQALKNFNGKELKNEETKVLTTGEVLANILSVATEGGKMKLFILAQKLFNGEEVEVDEADLNVIKQAVEKTTAYTNLVTGQILVTLSAIKK